MKFLFKTSIVVFLCGVSFAAQAKLQNLRLEKLYVKWLPGSYNNVSKCFQADDQVLGDDEAPMLELDSEGLFYEVELDVHRIGNKNCENLTIVKDQDLKRMNVELEEESSEKLKLSLKARLPFERVVFEDQEGRKLELLMEGKLIKLEDSNFLRFFKRSRFMGRAFMLNKPSFQAPIALLDYELPTFFDGSLLLQIQMGQSLLSFSSEPLFYGFYDMGLAWRFVGRGHPLEEPFNFKTRLVYEGVQINDPNSLNQYPALGTRLFGGGVEASSALSRNWALWNRTDYLLGVTSLYRISKIKTSMSVSYKISRRWRVEAGSRFTRLTQVNRILDLSDSVNELGFYMGMRLNPENLLD